MKNIEQLHQQLAYRPFRPFWLETIGGTRIHVQRAEWFVQVEGIGRFVVFGSGFVSVGHLADLTDVIEIEDR